jgi:MATE family multidrug resistance protein
VNVSTSTKSILRLAAPISLSLLIPQINFLTNTAFLGRLGEQELGVNGIAGIFYLVLSMIGYGLSNGIQIQMARRAGEGDNHGLAKTFMNGAMLVLGFSLMLMMMSLWLAPVIFGLSLHDSGNAFLSIKFLYIRTWGLPFLMLTQLANAFFISTSRSKFLIYGSCIGTLMNILFDYLLIFGYWGFPKMGLEGAAAGSVIAEVCYCAVMYGVFYFRKMYREYPVADHIFLDPKLAKRMLKISLPLIVQYLFSIGGWQVFFIFVEHLGQRELAASQILRSIFGIVGICTWAFAATCNTMVSNIIGQGRSGEVLSLIRRIAGISFTISLGICTILLVFSDAFISLYRPDPAIIEFARPSLRVIVSATLIMSIATVLFNGVVGTGNTLINLTIEVICVLTYLVYCYFVIEVNKMPLHWAWGSEFVYWISLLIICFAYLKTGRWRGKKI